MGLLQKAQKINYVGKGTFYSWAESQRFSHIGILEKKEGLFVLTHIYGLDASTVANSISPEGFWNENVPKSKNWVHFSASDPVCEEFNQIFSESFQQLIHTISFLRLSKAPDSPILINIVTRSDEPLPPDTIDKDLIKYFLETPLRTQYPSIDESLAETPAKLMILSLKTIIQNLSSSLSITSQVSQIFFDTIFESAFYSLQKAFQSPNYCTVGYNSEVKLALFSKSNLPEELISEQVRLLLSPILGLEAAKQIQLLAAGTTSKKEDIFDFLDKE
ncbi:MAG: hypothetical protein K6E51_11915 [Treponema sp.]|nr:hypothetical protein [Treponema sp.]